MDALFAQFVPWAIAQGPGWVVAVAEGFVAWKVITTLAARYEKALVDLATANANLAKVEEANKFLAYKALSERAIELERITGYLQKGGRRST